MGRWKNEFVGFEVLTAMIMESAILGDTTACSSLKANRRFGETFRLLLHARKISQAGNRSESRWKAELFDPENRSGMLLRNIG
jgi:hypothetical protein